WRAIERRAAAPARLCVPPRNCRRHTNRFASHRAIDDVTQTALRAIEIPTVSDKGIYQPSNFKQVPSSPQKMIKLKVSDKEHGGKIYVYQLVPRPYGKGTKTN